MQTIQPLKPQFKIDEDSSVHPVEQIRERVRSEDNYTDCKGYPLIKSENITGRLGKPLPESKMSW